MKSPSNGIAPISVMDGFKEVYQPLNQADRQRVMNALMEAFQPEKANNIDSNVRQQLIDLFNKKPDIPEIETSLDKILKDKNTSDVQNKILTILYINRGDQNVRNNYKMVLNEIKNRKRA